MCHIWKNWSHLEKCVTREKMGQTLKQWDTLGKLCHTWKNGSHLKKMGHLWKNESHSEILVTLGKM